MIIASLTTQTDSHTLEVKFQEPTVGIVIINGYVGNDTLEIKIGKDEVGFYNVKYAKYYNKLSLEELRSINKPMDEKIFQISWCI